MAEVQRSVNHRVKAVDTVEVTRVTFLRGQGIPSDPARDVESWWDGDGVLLVERDLWVDDRTKPPTEAEIEKLIEERKREVEPLLTSTEADKVQLVERVENQRATILRLNDENDKLLRTVDVLETTTDEQAALIGRLRRQTEDEGKLLHRMSVELEEERERVLVLTEARAALRHVRERADTNERRVVALRARLEDIRHWAAHWPRDEHTAADTLPSPYVEAQHDVMRLLEAEPDLSQYMREGMSPHPMPSHVWVLLSLSPLSTVDPDTSPEKIVEMIAVFEDHDEACKVQADWLGFAGARTTLLYRVTLGTVEAGGRATVKAPAAVERVIDEARGYLSLSEAGSLPGLEAALLDHDALPDVRVLVVTDPLLTDAHHFLRYMRSARGKFGDDEIGECDLAAERIAKAIEEAAK